MASILTTLLTILPVMSENFVSTFVTTMMDCQHNFLSDTVFFLLFNFYYTFIKKLVYIFNVFGHLFLSVNRVSYMPIHLHVLCILLSAISLWQERSCYASLLTYFGQILTLGDLHRILSYIFLLLVIYSAHEPYAREKHHKSRSKATPKGKRQKEKGSTSK